MRQHQSGFTLLEVLITIAILAGVLLASYEAQRVVINSQKVTTEAFDRMQSLERTMYWLSEDFKNLVNRKVTNDAGAEEKAVESGNDGEYVIKMTRSGWRNPAPESLPPRSSLQRVGYALNNDRLVRHYWPQVDVAQQVKPKKRLLIDQIEKLDIRFMDEAKEWHTQWPPLNVGTVDLLPNPIAVEVSLVSEDLGELKRLFAVRQ